MKITTLFLRKNNVIENTMYDIEFAVTEDASLVAVFLCSAGAGHE